MNEIIKLDQSIITYEVTDRAIEELKERYAGLSIIPDDKDTYETVRLAIADVRTLRTTVEKKRKELKADALEWGRKVDGEAKRITEALLEIETPLKDEKEKEDRRQIEIKAAEVKAETERQNRLRLKVVDIRKMATECIGMSSDGLDRLMHELDALELTEDEYQEWLPEAEEAKAETMAALTSAFERQAKAEQDELVRQAEIKQLEKLKAEREAEMAKLAEQRIEMERQARAELDRLDAERREIQKMKDAVEAERAAERQREHTIVEELENAADYAAAALTVKPDDELLKYEGPTVQEIEDDEPCLLPCPFCGSIEVELTWIKPEFDDGTPRIGCYNYKYMETDCELRVMCGACGAMGGLAIDFTAKQAIDEWNKRV